MPFAFEKLQVNQKALAGAALAIALVVGIGLRTVALDRVPLGFQQDEACNGYDAYSLITTAHDHHGNLLPIAIQGFNDYRMPLFDYSIAPLIGIFGLKPWVVRMGAALWGSADLIAIGLLAAELIGILAAPIAVILAALSPWHLAMSRFGVETISASATISWAMVCFLFALKRRDGRYLIGSGLIFGVSLYSYSITKPFTPLMIGLLAILYRRELIPMARWAAASVALFAIVAIPQAWMIAVHGDQMQAHFHQISILGAGGTAGTVVMNWLDHFSPSFLFGKGDWPILHPQDLIALPLAQALLAIAGLSALFLTDRRRTALLLCGWLAAAAIPGSMIRPVARASNFA